MDREQRRLAAILAADVVGYSRLMGRDESGTLARLKQLRKEHYEPALARHGGRIVKLTGDGALAEFGSAVDALNAAIEFQQALHAANSDVPEDRRIVFRVGLHVGDVLVDGSDLYGDGVNVASRLEGEAPPGGIVISVNAYDAVVNRVAASYRDMGELTLKNIERAVRAFLVGLEKLGPLGQSAAEPPATAAAAKAPPVEQRIAFCRAPDNVRLAWASVGSGPPLVKSANWLNHLEYDWESPVYRGLFRGLAQDHTLVRYDARGNGLSDREVDTIDFEAFVSDLETVMDAAGIERAPMFCMSQGCAVGVAFAVRHPERVSRMVLHGGFALGPLRRSAEETERTRAMMQLMKLGWGTDNPAFRQMFASLFFPDATKEIFDSFNELQRKCISGENAYRYREAVGNIDVRDLLGKVKVPVLVTHSRGDALVPWEFGRTMASEIPGARFVTLPSKNHVLLDSEPAHERLLEETRAFLAA